MARLHYVSTNKKIFMVCTQIFGALCCAVALILKYTGNYNLPLYIIFGVAVPLIVVVANYFPLFDAYVDKAADAHVYILTATAGLLLVLFIVTAFIAR